MPKDSLFKSAIYPPIWVSMKISRFSLFLLSTNALLLWMYVTKPSQQPVATIRAKETAIHPKLLQPNASPIVKPQPQVITVVTTNEFNWSQLETEDYRTYIKRLRDVGCPEQTIRDIIIADLDKLMAPRFKALDPEEEPKYWKAEEKDLRNRDELADKLFKKQNLDFEKRQVIQELMGVDLVAERAEVVGETDAMSKRLKFLSPDKLALVRMIHDRTALEETTIREKALAFNDSLSAEDRAKLQKAQLERDRKIQSLLTPEELEKYQLWYSPASFRTRDALAPLNPTEEEFNAVYALQKQFDANWNSVDLQNLPPALQAEYQASFNQMQEELKERLGPDRYKEYETAQDTDYRQLRIASAQFGLSPQTISEVLGFKNIVQEQRARVLTEQQLTPMQRDAVLQAISEETEKAVIEVMGLKPYQFYMRSGAGKWIKP